jgi:spore coat protein CotH
MSGLNIIFEGPPRWVLSEYLAYELYRRAGVRTEKSGHFRLVMDGRQLGYHLFIEQPNKTFLGRTGGNPDGNLYKILWYEHGVVRQHEKKTNLETGHQDVVNVIEGLNRKSGAAQWAYIQENFDVPEVAGYYAVNMCIENWDGFFNNYFTYHHPDRDGKWEIIPWDEDKTWGEYDGGPYNYDWFDMPLTYGMNGDNGGGGVRSFFGGGPFGGGAQWWRPPGYFSGPLLANPQFRKEFETKLRELCETVFNEEKFGPVVEALKLRLRPEVTLRAQVMHENPSGALQRFDNEIASYHRQLANRRRYILAHLPK